MNLGEVMVLNKKLYNVKSKEKEVKEYEESLIAARKWFVRRKLEMEEKIIKYYSYEFYFEHGLAVDSPAVRAIFNEEFDSWCKENDLIAKFENSRNPDSPRHKQFLIVEPIKNLSSI